MCARPATSVEYFTLPSSNSILFKLINISNGNYPNVTLEGPEKVPCTLY